MGLRFISYLQKGTGSGVPPASTNVVSGGRGGKLKGVAKSIQQGGGGISKVLPLSLATTYLVKYHAEGVKAVKFGHDAPHSDF